MNLSDRGARVVLTAAWALAIALVHPAGNFPINDDWSYADTVRRLVQHGEWQLNLRYLRDRRAVDVIAAVVLLIATTLVRQTGLALAIGAAAALLVASRSPRERVLSAACVVLPACALLVYTAFVRRSSAPGVYNMRETQMLQAVANPRLLVSLVMHSAATSYLYVGLFLIPMVPMIAPGKSSPALMVALAAMGASAGYIVKFGARMPLLGNVLHDVGLGPVLVARADLWPHAPIWFWVALTIGAAAAGALAVYACVSRIESCWKSPRRPAAILCGVSCAAYLAPMFAAGFLFDRYLGTPLLLVVAFLTTLGAFREPSRIALGTAIVLLGSVAAFDAAATRDLFAFNRARWEMVNDVLRKGTNAEDLNGGFEVTGGLLNRITGVSNARLMISLGDMPGYTRVSSHDFPRVIGSGSGTLYLLQREHATAVRP